MIVNKKNVYFPILMNNSGGGGSDSGGGDLAFNFEFGTTAPTDKNKLWVKCDEPNDYTISNVVLNDDLISIKTLDEQLNTETLLTMPYQCFTIGTDIYSYYDWCDLQKFDTLTKTTTRMNVEFDDNHLFSCATSVGTNGYIIGGHTTQAFIQTILKYDSVTNTITTMNTSLTDNYVYDINACSIGSDIYIFGGWGGGNPQHGTLIKKYDTLTDTISTVGSMDTTSTGVGVGSILNNIYMFGGINAGKLYSHIQKFDVSTNTRTTLGNMNYSLKHLGVFAHNDLFYLFGGSVSDSSHYNKIFKYNTTSNTWEELTLTLSKAGQSGVGVVGNSAYIFNGKTIQKFNATQPLNQGELLLIEHDNNPLPILKYKEKYLDISLLSAYIGDSTNSAEKVEIFKFNNNTFAWEKII